MAAGRRPGGAEPLGEGDGGRWPRPVPRGHVYPGSWGLGVEAPGGVRGLAELGLQKNTRSSSDVGAEGAPRGPGLHLQLCPEPWEGQPQFNSARTWWLSCHHLSTFPPISR